MQAYIRTIFFVLVSDLHLLDFEGFFNLIGVGNWVVAGRSAYYAMKACIRVMDVVAGAWSVD